MSQDKKAVEQAPIEEKSKRIRRTPDKYNDFETPKTTGKNDEGLFHVTDLKEKTSKNEDKVEGIKKQNKMVDKKQLLERLKKIKSSVSTLSLNEEKVDESIKTENGIKEEKKVHVEPPKPEVKSKPVSKTTPSRKKKEIEEDIYEPLTNLNKTKTPKEDTPRPKRKKPKVDHNFDDLKPHMQLCYKLLQEIKKDEWSWPFAEPVDIVALNIPDYYSIIKYPMDLKTVETNIFSNKYETVQQFATDMRRIWTNCYTYNPPETDVSLMAKKLDTLFEEKFKKLVEQMDSSQYKNKVIEMEQQISNLKEKLEKTENEEVSKKKKPIKVPNTSHLNNTGINLLENKQMTFEEKKKLSDNISKLDSNKLAKVVEIIQSRAPKASSQATETEIEIDLDKLDNVTLRQIEKHVKSALNKNRTKKKRTSNNNEQHSVEKIVQNEKKEVKKNSEETESSEGESSSGEETNSDTDEEKDQQTNNTNTNTNNIPNPITQV
jgi:hypothetical protein